MVKKWGNENKLRGEEVRRMTTIKSGTGVKRKHLLLGKGSKVAIVTNLTRVSATLWISSAHEYFGNVFVTTR